MKRGLIALALVLAMAPASAGDAQLGRDKARAAKCFECHGENGVATASGYPNLAGQYPAYLEKQLHDFRSGARKSPFMTLVAAGLAENDLADLAAYFGSLARTRNAPLAADPAGQKLYANACASCHGAKGENQPALAGQQLFYLREQLLNFHLGARNNSPGRVMNQAADTLTEAEIDALARYISSL